MGMCEMVLPCKRKVVAVINFILAMLIGVVGFGIIGVLYEFNNQKFMQSYANLRDFSDVTFQWSFSIACCLLQVGLCGGAASYITSRPLAIMFGLILTPIWILLAIMAVTSSSILIGASGKGLTGFCPASDNSVNVP